MTDNQKKQIKNTAKYANVKLKPIDETTFKIESIGSDVFYTKHFSQVNLVKTRFGWKYRINTSGRNNGEIWVQSSNIIKLMRKNVNVGYLIYVDYAPYLNKIKKSKFFKEVEAEDIPSDYYVDSWFESKSNKKKSRISDDLEEDFEDDIEQSSNSKKSKITISEDELDFEELED